VQQKLLEDALGKGFGVYLDDGSFYESRKLKEFEIRMYGDSESTVGMIRIPNRKFKPNDECYQRFMGFTEAINRDFKTGIANTRQDFAKYMHDGENIQFETGQNKGQFRINLASETPKGREDYVKTLKNTRRAGLAMEVLGWMGILSLYNSNPQAGIILTAIYAIGGDVIFGYYGGYKLRNRFSAPLYFIGEGLARIYYYFSDLSSSSHLKDFINGFMKKEKKVEDLESKFKTSTKIRTLHSLLERMRNLKTEKNSAWRGLNTVFSNFDSKKGLVIRYETPKRRDTFNFCASILGEKITPEEETEIEKIPDIWKIEVPTKEEELEDPWKVKK